MLYILRHGLTDWNAEHKLQGQSDIPLNDTGRQMAVDAGIHNKDINIDVCYASPLCRAYETAQLFLQNAGYDITLPEDECDVVSGRDECDLTSGENTGYVIAVESGDNVISPNYTENVKSSEDEVRNNGKEIEQGSEIINSKNIMRKKAVSIIRDDRLMEMNFGIYEGTKDSFDIPDCPVNDFFFEPEVYKRVEKAESMEELLGRTSAFYREVIVPDLEAGKDVLVVGHGAMNCAMITGIYERPVSDFWMSMTGNCQLIKITEDGVFAALEGDTFGIPNWPPKREDYQK